jgi:RHS repeat-associated protein
MKFTGHERDTLAGDNHTLDYMHAWYYGAAVGRFLSFDQGPEHLEDPQSWNRYSYVGNNPVTYDDPTGNERPYNPKRNFDSRGTARIASTLKTIDHAVSMAVPILMMVGAVIDAGKMFEVGGPDAMTETFEAEAEEAIQAEAELAEDSLVVRGGQNQPENFVKGSGIKIDANEKLQNVSGSSAPGKTAQQLSTSIRHKQIGVTTVGEVRAAGGQVTPSPSPNNPDHCTLCGITPAKASSLFTPTVPNPNIKKVTTP